MQCLYFILILKGYFHQQHHTLLITIALCFLQQQQETNLLANLTTNDARDNSKDFQNSKVGAAATSRDEGETQKCIQKPLHEK
ncbi:chromosome 18 open reading frame 2, isoform CRA_b, partial [Homo sapiens]|uniref:Isoform 3 of Putative uncharacterized protein encoded by LINC00470 n=1 Tax=Homo sapiens TaxID=9606 RepID=Q9BZP3-3